MNSLKRLLFAIGLLSMVINAHADIGLPSLIGDNMVLQRNAKVKIWGWSGAAEKITVTPSWSNNPDTITADRNGKWAVYVQTPEAGGPYIMIISGSWGQRVVLQNILIGEVWICSGQSNMDATYNYIRIKEVGKDAIDGNNPNIRFCKIRKTTAEYPQDNCMAKWELCDSNTIKDMSAVAFYFIRKLNKDLKVPIGLIQAAWGGTGIEPWMPEGVVKNNPLFMRSAGMRKALPWWPHLPGSTYNAMIAPVTNYNIAGAIWYQGETNSDYPSAYKSLMSTMISEWRKAWNIDLPFYYVQIAPWTNNANDSSAFLREAQMQCLTQHKVGMVVVTDLVDDVKDIHPQNKHDVGYRLANLALTKTYGLDGFSWRCPVYQKMEINKDRITVYFDADIMVDGDRVKELYIAGDDRVFYPAEGTVEGNKLTVRAKQVKAPVSVRFSFNDDGIGNLFSTEKLPVSPFRTDNW